VFFSTRAAELQPPTFLHSHTSHTPAERKEINEVT